jgi:hypothetical protein
VRIDKANPKSVELLPLNQHHDLIVAGNSGLGQVAEGLKHSPALAKTAEGKLTRDKGMRQYAPPRRSANTGSLLFRWSIHTEVSTMITEHPSVGAGQA